MWLLKKSIMQFLDIVMYLVILQAVLSWFVKDLRNPLVRFLFEVTDPLLAPFRAIQYKLGLDIGLDFSPIFLFIVIEFIQKAVGLYL